MKLHIRTHHESGKAETYQTNGTRRGDRNAEIRNTVYGVVGLVLLVASALIVWGPLKQLAANRIGTSGIPAVPQ